MEETHFSESSATEEEEAERFVEAVVERLKTNVSASQAVSYSDAILRNERLAAATRASGHKSKGTACVVTSTITIAYELLVFPSPLQALIIRAHACLLFVTNIHNIP